MAPPPTNYLTFPEVSVDTHVSGSACQALVLAVWDVLACQWVNVLLGQTKVDDVHCVLIRHSKPAHQEVLGLDIPIDQMFAVDVLQSGNL